jgi:hypothetical protein
VQIGPYKLYKKESRYYFMKEKKDGFSIVFKVPDDKKVDFSDQDVPFLTAKPVEPALVAPAETPRPEPGTKPKVVQSDDSGRRQVQVDDYKLYKKGSRYYFMKEKKDGFGVVFKVPNGKHAVYGANGVPILKQSPIPGQRVKVVQTDDSGRRQVQADDYKLYRKDNRFYFMKEKKDGFSLVFRVPDDKEVVYGANGVPLVRAKS